MLQKYKSCRGSNSLIRKGGGIRMGPVRMDVVHRKSLPLATVLWLDCGLTYRNFQHQSLLPCAGLQSNLQFSFICSLFVLCFQSTDKFHKSQLTKKVLYGNPVPEEKVLWCLEKRTEVCQIVWKQFGIWYQWGPGKSLHWTKYLTSSSAFQMTSVTWRN